jgi:hypothetical protein
MVNPYKKFEAGQILIHGNHPSRSLGLATDYLHSVHIDHCWRVNVIISNY